MTKPLPGSDRETFKPAGPGAWIQWKGTTVCADFFCPDCGGDHIDADFAYYVQCACGHIYYLNGNIELVKLTEEEKSDVLCRKLACVVIPDSYDGDDDDSSFGGGAGEHG